MIIILKVLRGCYSWVWWVGVNEVVYALQSCLRTLCMMFVNVYGWVMLHTVVMVSLEGLVRKTDLGIS